MGEQKQFRCAVYTRKSSEEGLEQDFNSLEAQREACEAYIRSQAHEGWKLIPDRFDDGGFSGGNMHRPGLEQLMAMIRAGKIDVIVIYKIDRLTRSLTDFARLAEVLDQHNVSFVSVTQQFNTTTSMGRLMLNVLLSFAQFEREITGERIRDKIAASKKKGMWMGGSPPMGYAAKDRTLVVNETDAAIIRDIFTGYLDAGDVPTLLERLAAMMVTTNPRTSAKGRASGGRPFTRGHLYKLLSNPIYIGRIPHKTTSYPGQHPPIIDRALWDLVQAQLAANTQGTRNRRRRAKAEGALLAGLLCSEAGNRMIVAHATKGARRYRYYVEEQPADQGTTQSPCEPIRLPAVEIEAAAITALRLFLGDPRQVLLHLDDLEPDRKAAALRRLPQLGTGLNEQSGQATKKLFRSLVSRVTYRRDTLALAIGSRALRTALGVADPDPTWPRNADDPAATFVITAPLLYRRRGVQAKIVVDGSTHERRPDPALVTMIVRARNWADRLINGEAQTMAEIAAAEGVSVQYVVRLMPLAFLAPKIVEQVIAGTQPVEVTANRLAWVEELPPLWGEQERMIGEIAIRRELDSTTVTPSVGERAAG